MIHQLDEQDDEENTCEPQGEADSKSENLSKLKNILVNIQKDRYDKFELRTLMVKFEVIAAGETEYSRMKYFLQRKILENILEEDQNIYFQRLLEETERFCNLKKTQGYSCCLTGCLYRTYGHRQYIKHLQKVHFNHTRLVCKYMNKCMREFTSMQLMIQHIKQSHSSAPVPPIVVECTESVAVACKCDMISCGGKKFNSVKHLMTHINTDHMKDHRVCIFEECEQKFANNAESRHHFSKRHIKLNKTKLKSRHLVNPEQNSDIGVSGLQLDSEEIQYPDMYTEEDLSLLECSIDSDSDAAEDVNNCEDKNFLKAYADFLNRMCYEKHVSLTTMNLIASDFSYQLKKSTEMTERKLRTSLTNLNLPPTVTDKIVADTFGDNELLKAQQELNTGYKLNKFVQENFQYCAPLEIVLNKSEVEKGIPKDSFHYIPVDEAFKTLVEDKSFNEMMDKDKDLKQRKAGVIYDVKDGQVYSNMEYFKQNPDAFCAIFYSGKLSKLSANFLIFPLL